MKYILILIIAVFLISCKESVKEKTVAANVKYTCSMHPQILENEFGKCPICHMDLIPVTNNQQQNGEMVLTDQQIKLGNIQVDIVGTGSLGNELLLNATLVLDQSKTNAISAKVTGRIEKLYFKNINDFIPKGAKLFDLYSEELNNAKQEYVALVEKKATLGNSLIDFKSLIESAKTKLLLWGMTESQIRNLLKSTGSSNITSFYSTESGYITTLNIIEGEYVNAGGTVVELANLNTLWAEIQLYTSQLASIDRDEEVIVTFPDLPGKSVHAKIDFQYPEIGSDSKINLLRVNIPNTDQILKPGMTAKVVIKNSQASGLLVPENAILREHDKPKVWLRIPNGHFISKVVELGSESNGFVEIKSGLTKGNVVVTSGSYLLNSEEVFRRGSN
ncbi:MAG: efflux transporter, family, subunit [Daejeonella sp.]|nr:efflux transporter, family, subunit [Daejeonella sp.]